MTVVWEQTKGNHFQSRKGIDELGNIYQMTANLERVSCKTPDGFSGSGWTEQEALTAATNNKEADQASPIEMTVYQRILEVINEIREQELVTLRLSQAETLAEAIATEVNDLVREQRDVIITRVQDTLDRIEGQND